MVEHVVLFAVRPGTSPELMERMLEGVRGLKGRVPGVLAASAGPTFSDRGAQYTHGLVVRLENREALKTYADHPAHVEVVNECIKPIIDGLLVLDWDC